MTSRYLANQQPVEQAQAPEEEKVTVLVCRQKLPGFTALRDPKLFEEKEYPRSQVAILKDPIDKFDKVKGRTLKNNMEAGKPVTESDLLPSNVEALEYKLKKGE